MFYFCIVLLYVSLYEVEIIPWLPSPFSTKLSGFFVCMMITLFCIVLGNLMHIPRKIFFFQ